MKTEPQPKVSVVFRFTWNMNSEEASGALMKYQAWLPDVPAGLGMGFLYGKGNEADTLKVEIEGMSYLTFSNHPTNIGFSNFIST